MARKSRKQALAALDILEQTHGDAHCALAHANPWQLLVATILSAQCTDERVNQVTPELFARFPDPAAFAAADLETLEEAVRSTGFFRNKAKNIQACARTLVAEYQGRVPRSLEQLVGLPGVGRKTANVVLGVAFDIPGMVVDTHVKRVAFRLGWTRESDPAKIEQDLIRLLPEERWTRAGHLLIFHGRRLCKAQRPLCSSCPLAGLCPRRGVRTSQ